MTKAQKKLILINDEVLSPYEVASIAPRIENAGAVGVDFAELMLKGDSVQSEQTMGAVYVTLATLSKNLGVPIILLSQLNRSYEGTLPKMNMLRYTGLAEAMSSLVLLLYNPNQVFIGANNSEALPIQDGKGYIIVAKSRYGYNRGLVEQHTSVGAIQSDWDGASGWGGESIWFPLAGV